MVGAEGGLDGLGSPVGWCHGDFEGEKLWILMDGGFVCFCYWERDVRGRELTYMATYPRTEYIPMYFIVSDLFFLCTAVLLGGR